MLFIIVSAAIFSSLALSQSLSQATNNYPELSQFRTLLDLHPDLIPTTNVSSTLTVLIPNDNAFADFLTDTGRNVSSLSLDTLTNHFQYHTVVGGLDLQQSTNVLVNTELTADVYDHRNGSAGQVLFITQGSNSTDAVVKAGAGHKVNMNIVNGSFQGGQFQILDGFLTLPKTCTDTMEDAANRFTTLISALQRTNLTDTLNNFANVTCLAPNNAAFERAGNPDQTLPVDQLAGALEYHTLPGAQYSTGLRDGDTFQAANGGTVQVHVINNGTIYFNDARVINLNVITNNGVIHVLDRVMSVINATSTSSTPASTVTSSSTSGSSSAASATSTSSKSSSTASANAAARELGSLYFPAFIAVAALAI